MIKRLKLTRRRKLLGAVVICLALITGSTMLWQMGQVAEAAILYPHHSGLVGWWRFDEIAGTVAKDSSGNGNDAAIYGAEWIDGKHGKALEFDGADDYVFVPELGTVDEISISLWVNMPVFKEGGLVSRWSGWGVATASYALWQWGAAKQFLFSVQGTVNRSPNVVYTFADGDLGYWHHVVAQYSKSEGKLRMYVNGVLRSSADFAESISYPTLPTYIGRRDGGFFNGTVDEVRIYNRALSQAEIQELFQKKPDFSSKLLAKIPKGTTQVIITSSWQGIGSLNATIESPLENYTEDMVPIYQKTSYSTSGGTSEMLNIKRLSISIPALLSDENWYITLDFDDVEDYTIKVEIQK